MRGLLSGATLAMLLAFVVGTASSSATGPVAAAKGIAIQVVVPGQSGAVASVAASPPDASTGGGFAYPADGSVLSAGSTSAKAASAAQSALTTAAASAQASSVSLFGGEVTVDSVSAGASVSATASSSSGDFPGAGVTNLVASGQALSSAAGSRVSLGEWGYADVLAQASAPGGISGAPSYQESMTALAVHLTVDHGGLPAGSAILIGYAEATAQGMAPLPPAPPTTTIAPPPPPPPTTTAAPLRPSPKPSPPRATTPTVPKATKSPAVKRSKLARPKPEPPLRAPEPPEAAPGGGLPVVHAPPLTASPELTAGRYVFPVYGPSSYTDTFGAPRADVVWHHGDDIFAPLGAPVLAVANGTVFSVGWNHIGGYRLWLRDRKGNQFYYAHLSAYSPVAVNGRRVRSGTVLGFVGNTGDAVGTPYHLHFEIHPAGLLHLGYDGAVDPTRYLDAWRHLQDVRFAPAGWAAPPGRAKRGVKPAPPPGAILLQATDISTASGLDPASLERVLAPIEAEGDGALVGFSQQPPAGPRPVRPG